MTPSMLLGELSKLFENFSSAIRANASVQLRLLSEKDLCFLNGECAKLFACSVRIILGKLFPSPNIGDYFNKKNAEFEFEKNYFFKLIKL